MWKNIISHCVRPKRFQRVGNAVKQSNGKVQMSPLLPCGNAKGEHSATLRDASALSEAMPLAYSAGLQATRSVSQTSLL